LRSLLNNGEDKWKCYTKSREHTLFYSCSSSGYNFYDGCSDGTGDSTEPMPESLSF